MIWDRSMTPRQRLSPCRCSAAARLKLPPLFPTHHPPRERRNGSNKNRPCFVQENRDLGSFQDPETAARAHDVALLRLRGDAVREEDLNFPPGNYDQAAVREVQQAPVAEYLSILHQYGSIGDRRNSRRPPPRPPRPPSPILKPMCRDLEM